MTYVLSDIHGNLRRFQSILDQICFTDKDTLYVLGDVVDRHPYGIEILRMIMDMPNAKMLVGNHEYMMLDVWRPSGPRPEQSAIARWQRNGCAPTNSALARLGPSERNSVLDFVAGLPLSFDIEVAGKRYKLVHAAPVEWYNPAAEGKYRDEREFAVWKRYDDVSLMDIGDYTLVFGHTPTLYYKTAEPQTIYKTEKAIGIDCGSGYDEGTTRGFRLACLRLEDGKEFYSEEELYPAYL